MNDRYQLLFQTARKRAGLTQETAAERIGLEVRSISNYENGITIPCPDTVKRMEEVYCAPWISNQYCNQCPLGEYRSLPDNEQSLHQLAVEFAYSFGDLNQFKADVQRILAIALDGVIDDNETQDFLNIMSRIAACGLLAEKMRIQIALQSGKRRRTHETGRRI